MKRLRHALAVLLVCIGGLLYAYFLSIPARLAVPLLAALTVEAALYVASMSEGGRGWAQRNLAPLPVWLALSGLLPYLVCALPLHTFVWTRFALLAALAAGVAFWYAVMPRGRVWDLAFVAMVAAGLLFAPFGRIYPSPRGSLQMAILGQLMWTRLAIVAVLGVGGAKVRGFGLFPTRKEWVAGLRNFGLFVPVGALLGWSWHIARFHPHPADWRIAPLALATFLGMLWVVALREEFFFRGLLQEWLTHDTHSEWAGLIAAAVLFGAVHLGFRGFPNWRFAALAAVAGLFYGRAYMEAKSVRAAMVAHALVNTTWRVLFS